MPVEFLSDEQAAVYGRFNGPPSRAELERFFYLDDVDRERIARRRGEHNRLGFAVQLGSVRFLGTFLPDPLEVPWEVVEYLGGQLGVVDVSVVKAYTEREKTPLEHAWEIRQAFGFGDFASAETGLREFLAARAWTRPERPSALFDQAVTWLRAGRVLLPGVSVLARLVAEVRADATGRLHGRGRGAGRGCAAGSAGVAGPAGADGGCVGAAPAAADASYGDAAGHGAGAAGDGGR